MQPKGCFLDGDHIGLAVTALFWSRSGPDMRRPHQGLRLNARDIATPQLDNAIAQLDVVTIAGIQQQDAARKPSLTRPAYLIERNLRLGLEADLRRYPGRVPARHIFRPCL